MRHHANRGMKLEKFIDLSCKQYAAKGLAQINKIPTPMKMKAKYNSGPAAYYAEKSTVDFIGIYNGLYQAFDTKETKVPRLELKKVPQHQVSFLREAARLGGQAYLIVYFSHVEEMYKIRIEKFERYFKENDRKSIPLEWFRENTTRIKSAHGIAFDFLEHFTVTK